MGINVLHVIRSLQEGAGTSVFCVKLVDHLTDYRCMCDVAVNVGNADVWLPMKQMKPIKTMTFPCTARDYDLVHTHGLWNYLPHKAISYAKKRNIPVVFSTHGMTTEWAMQNSKWKKRIAMALFQKNDLKKVDMFHATAEREVEDIRRLGLNQPVFIAPLGVDCVNRVDNSEKTGVKQILFLSRIHPTKGIVNLLNAWELARKPGWELLIAGLDEGGHTAELKKHCVSLGLGESVKFLGAVYGSKKRELYCSTDVFVLPTFSENFGVVVLEALSFGLPVITTKRAPWSELNGVESLGVGRSGWWVEIGVDPLVRALRESMAMSDAERAVLGNNGRKLVRRKYSWDNCAESTMDAYKWLLNGGSIPSCLRLI